MIQNPNNWSPRMQPSPPNPWNNNNNNQINWQHGQSDIEMKECCCQRIQCCCCPDWRGMQGKQEELYEESESPEVMASSISEIANQSNSSNLMSEQQNFQQPQKNHQTIGHLIESISFDKKKQIRKKHNNPKSETSSKSSKSLRSSYDANQLALLVKAQQSKCWNKEQQQLFYKLVGEFGTDFNFIKQYFPKKSKNQVKSKYKEMMNMKKKSGRKQGKVGMSESSKVEEKSGSDMMMMEKEESQKEGQWKK